MSLIANEAAKTAGILWQAFQKGHVPAILVGGAALLKQNLRTVTKDLDVNVAPSIRSPSFLKYSDLKIVESKAATSEQDEKGTFLWKPQENSNHIDATYLSGARTDISIDIKVLTVEEIQKMLPYTFVDADGVTIARTNLIAALKMRAWINRISDGKREKDQDDLETCFYSMVDKKEIMPPALKAEYFLEDHVAAFLKEHPDDAWLFKKVKILASDEPEET